MSNISQRLILGLRNKSLDNDERVILKKLRPGGIILFDRNIDSLNQLKSLVKEVSSIIPATSFIAIDFEGGRVRRGKEIFANLEKPEYYRDNGLGLLPEHISIIAKQFNEVGINLDFAPVADLAYKPLNPALMGRVYSDSPLQVSKYCRIFIESFQRNNIKCCLKHFPGLGSAANDPHDEVSVSCQPVSRIMENDINCFKAGVDAGARFMMTTHIILNGLDNVIATYSSKVIQLARSIGFNGIIITDDLSMGAVKGDDLAESVLKSLLAGHDMALICHDHDRYEDIVSYLEQNENTLRDHGHTESISRIGNVKKAIA